MRLIDVEPFENNGDCEIHFNYIETGEQSRKSIDTRDIPTAKPKKGNWILKKISKTDKIYTICDQCMSSISVKADKWTLTKLDMRGSYYCPSCGAYMKKKV